MDDKQWDGKIWVTVTQAAQQLNCDKETVRRYLRADKLIGKKNTITGTWHISRDSLETLVSSRAEMEQLKARREAEQGKREGE